MAEQFVVTFDGEVTLERDEVWPDQDGPTNPTAEDVAAVMRKCGRMGDVLHDWMLAPCIEVRVDGVRVWKP